MKLENWFYQLVVIAVFGGKRRLPTDTSHVTSPHFTPSSLLPSKGRMPRGVQAEGITVMIVLSIHTHIHTNIQHAHIISTHAHTRTNTHVYRHAHANRSTHIKIAYKDLNITSHRTFQLILFVTNFTAALNTTPDSEKSLDEFKRKNSREV